MPKEYLTDEEMDALIGGREFDRKMFKEHLTDEEMELLISGRELDLLFQKWGKRYGVDWQLLKAIGIVESDLDPNAIGDRGESFGLMQVQFPTGKGYGVKTIKSLFDPDENIRAATAYLADMIDKYGEEEAIQIYTMGETRWTEGAKNLKRLAQIKQIREKFGKKPGEIFEETIKEKFKKKSFPYTMRRVDYPSFIPKEIPPGPGDLELTIYDRLPGETTMDGIMRRQREKERKIQRIIPTEE